MTVTLLVVEFAVVEIEAVMTTRSNPVPVQLTVSGLARLMAVREAQFVTVKADGRVADVVNGNTWVPPLPVSV